MLLATFGCQSAAAYRQKLQSPYPLDRARAAVHLAEAGDATAVHKLVDLLDDDDRGVRLYSIVALERLCGTTFDYRYYAPQAERDAAVARWRDALRNGTVALRRGGAGASAEPVRGGALELRTAPAAAPLSAASLNGAQP